MRGNFKRRRVRHWGLVGKEGARPLHRSWGQAESGFSATCGAMSTARRRGAPAAATKSVRDEDATL